jgi:hypothetical protein
MVSFTGILRKPIDPSEAPARGLRAAFALPPDESDLRSYVAAEMIARWEAFDGMFQLNSKAPDIWVQRSKVLIERSFNVDRSDPHWWMTLAFYLARGHVHGLSFKKSGKKKHGTPCKWTDERLAQLWADVEFLKRATKLSVQEICEKMRRSKGYARRWGDCTAAALRKQHSRTVKLKQGLLFQCTLYGPESLTPGNAADRTEAAIELHSLRIPF